MSLRRHVAISAVALVCGLGDGGPITRRALREGAGAARPLSGDWACHLPTSVGVEVCGEVPEPEGFVDDRKVGLLARAAASLSFETALPPARRGVFLGTGLSSVTPRELAEDVYPHLRNGRIDRIAARQDLRRGVAPARHLPARATAWLADRLMARGAGGTSFSACAAAAEAIVRGARAVARGEADRVVAGGHDSMLHPLGLLSFQALGALSATAARPFDTTRDGFVPGEGAALFVLEPLDRAEHALGVIRGAGSSLDAHGVTAPHPDGRGAEAAMRRALVDAGLSPDAVAWVNAHATGTPVGDRAEAAAIQRVLGRVPVTSLKGAIGHALAAAGALELALTLLAWQEGVVPATVGCENVEAGLDLDVVRTPRRSDPGPVLSNSFGFGGQNVSIVVTPEAP